MQGIGYGFTIHEILDGKAKSATSEVWEAIRGGSANAVFRNGDGKEDNPIRFHADLFSKDSTPKSVQYEIAFSARHGFVREERLSSQKDIYNSKPDLAPLIENTPDSPVLSVRYYQGKKGKQPHLSFEKARPVLHQLSKRKECSATHKPTVLAVEEMLSDIQRVDPSPAILRSYSQAHSIQRMGERGENFAALIKTICENEKSKNAYLTWLRELTPTEVDDVGIRPGAVEEPMFVLKEKGREFPAPVLSDGTLRFAAIAAAFFQPACRQC